MAWRWARGCRPGLGHRLPQQDEVFAGGARGPPVRTGGRCHPGARVTPAVAGIEGLPLVQAGLVLAAAQESMARLRATPRSQLERRPRAGSKRATSSQQRKKVSWSTSSARCRSPTMRKATA